MKLGELFDAMRGWAEALENPGGADPDITRVEYDSRRVSKSEHGVIFACVVGENSDGHDFAEKAVEAGAAALLCERRLPVRVPQIVARRARAAMSKAASVVCGNPASRMKMIGFTGTNGKTTTSYLTRSIIRASGAVAGMIGTIVYDDGESESFADRTTPEGPDIQMALSKMVEKGASHCVMEASSHGLDQGRLEGCLFDRVGFSNLTPEHLEYHDGMERYFEAKRKLFSDYTAPGWLGAVNADDEYGNSLMREFEGNAIGYSLKAGGEKPRVKLYGGIVREIGIKGMSLSVARPDGKSYEVDSPLIGEYNASNILESFVIADSLGFEIASILSGIRNCKRVPGRLERYSLSNGVTVFVDYAHSADGMEQALGTLASLSRGPIRVLWGAGGDRTPIKRPVVGNIMARLASHVVITTDNPRGEDPADIARDVERGVKNSGSGVRCDTILDRKEAINHVLDASLPGDVVLIAGKGPERFIEYKTRKVPFVDSEAVLEWARGHSAEEILG